MNSNHVLHAAFSKYGNVCPVSASKLERVEDRFFTETRYSRIVLRRDLLNKFYAITVYDLCQLRIYPEASNIRAWDRFQNLLSNTVPDYYDLCLCSVDYGLKELLPEYIFSEEREGPDEQNHEDRIKDYLLPKTHYQKKIRDTCKCKGCEPGGKLPVVYAAV